MIRNLLPVCNIVQGGATLRITCGQRPTGVVHENRRLGCEKSFARAPGSRYLDFPITSQRYSTEAGQLQSTPDARVIVFRQIGRVWDTRYNDHAEKHTQRR